MLHSLIAVNHTSTGSDHRILHLDRSIHTILDRLEALCTLIRNDLTQSPFLRLLDQQIRVNKLVPKYLRKNDTDAALPRTRHPYQCNIIHTVSFHFSITATKSQ